MAKIDKIMANVTPSSLNGIDNADVSAENQFLHLELTRANDDKETPKRLASFIVKHNPDLQNDVWLTLCAKVQYTLESIKKVLPYTSEEENAGIDKLIERLSKGVTPQEVENDPILLRYFISARAAYNRLGSAAKKQSA